MKNQSFKIWCNNYFSENQLAEKALLKATLKEHELQFFDAKENGAAGESREFLLAADIAFGQPDAETVMRSEKLRWIHLNSAGYTAYDRDDLKQNLKARSAILTNSSAVYDEPCAQHLLAMMMSLMRGLPYALEAQSSDKSWQQLRPRLHLPENQTAMIFGYGSIARRLVELLAPLRMNLIGVRRRPQSGETIKIILEEEADALLPQADHVINILPENQGTKNYFNRERLMKFKLSAYFYNIGRGTTIDQNALIENLNTGKIAAAYLDVTDPEPLPPEHRLWTTTNCFITPHIGGGSANEKARQVNHFLENLRRFETSGELLNRIV